MLSDAELDDIVEQWGRDMLGKRAMDWMDLYRRISAAATERAAKVAEEWSVLIAAAIRKGAALAQPQEQADPDPNT